jgi:hypothetical protein
MAGAPFPGISSLRRGILRLRQAGGERSILSRNYTVNAGRRPNVTADDHDAAPDDDRARLRGILLVLPMMLLCLCVVALLLPLMQAPLFGRAVGAVPPNAVRVSAAAYPYGPALVDRVITDPRLVRDLWARLNALPAFTGRMGCALAPPDLVRYTFRFTRWGTPVMAAELVAFGCAPRRWSVSSGGYGYGRLDETGATTRAILAEAGLPPLPTEDG